MKTCIYARKSTHKLGQKETIENQIKICRSKGKELGLEIVDIKQDVGTGRDDLNRPEIKELISDALEGKYQCVIMKGISRLFRDTEKGLGLIKLLDRNNIRVITVEEMFDSGNPESRTGTGKLDLSKITMYLMFSEMESKKLGDRVKYTQIEKAKNGEWNQPNNTPFGYSYNPETKKLIVNPEEAKIVKLIFDLYRNGLGIRSIMNYLNGENQEKIKYPTPNKGKLWNQYTINFILKNEAYTGDVIYNKRTKKERTYKNPELYGKDKSDIWIGADYNPEEEWIIARNAHEPIISRDMFADVQRIMNNKATRKGIRSNVGLLAGIAKCGLCGASMTFKRGNRDKNGRIKTRNNYYCMNYIKYGNKVCTSHHVKAEDLENTIIDEIEALAKDEKMLNDLIIEICQIRKNDKEIQRLKNEQNYYENEIEKTLNKMNKLLERNIEGIISDVQFKEMNKRFSEELQKYQEQLLEIKEKIPKLKEEEFRIDEFKKLISRCINLKEKTKEEIRHLLLGLINKVIINEKGEIEKLTYKF